jgi:hypothetical protein
MKPIAGHVVKEKVVALVANSLNYDDGLCSCNYGSIQDHDAKLAMVICSIVEYSFPRYLLVSYH